MSTTVQVRQRGTLTLPADLRTKYNIKTGDIFNLVDLDGVFVLSLMTPMVPEIAHEIERLRIEAGFSIEEMLQTLREQRAQYNTENYNDGDESA
ncbi:MAG: AbrB/MazE/SpoVT family DNA-binding domain-containing protein [Anaerolineae bacterium]|nr:AbrB/MazE/SpoVT family DNA-binding domain-containing protein [Anaerolineae bacterium]